MTNVPYNVPPSRSLADAIRDPSLTGLLIAVLLSFIPFMWPLTIYIVLRYVTGHRAIRGLDTSAMTGGSLPHPAVPVANRSAANAAQRGVSRSGPTTTTKTCPDCAETVLRGARICRFCRFEFPIEAVSVADVEQPAAASTASTPTSGTDRHGRRFVVCSLCGRDTHPEWERVCQSCGWEIPEANRRWGVEPARLSS